MRFLHYDFRAGPSDIIEVTLDRQANVRLLDSVNFQRYRQGRDHRYYGGLAQVSPFRLTPPHEGQWHVAVDLGGYDGSVRASARLIAYS
jgi:hypothetical protein